MDPYIFEVMLFDFVLNFGVTYKRVSVNRILMICHGHDVEKTF